MFEDGQQRRNFVHVDDVADAVAAAARRRPPDGRDAVNIGSARVTTIGEMAALLSRRGRRSGTGDHRRYRLGDVRHITADCRAAERVLGWRAGIDLDEGVKDLVDGGAVRIP